MNGGTFTFSRPTEVRRPMAVGPRWRNLAVWTNTDTSPALWANITADEVILTDERGRTKLVRSPHLLPRPYQPFGDDASGLTLKVAPGVAYSGRAGLQGDGGLDTGGVPGLGWYYLWLMCDESGLKVNAYYSLSATAPRMKNGMVFKVRIGAIQLLSAAYMFPFRQVDDFVAVGDHAVGDYVWILETGVTSWTELAGAMLTRFQKMVPPPPVCKSAGLLVKHVVSGSHIGVALASQVSGATVLGERKIKVGQAGFAGGSYSSQLCDLSLLDHKFWYKMDSTAATYIMQVQSWRL